MSEPTLPMPVLCLITDPTMPDLIPRAERAVAGGVNMLQLRGHTLPAGELYRLALALRALCSRYQATFIVNDRIDVGLAVGADGFQLGARSLPLPIARQVTGAQYLLGASVHSCEEALAAAKSGVDFLLAGTIFASLTHPAEQPCGTDLLRAIKRRLPTYPLLAVGGITQANIGEAIQAGADGVAVITTLLQTADGKQAARDLWSTIRQEQYHE